MSTKRELYRVSVFDSQTDGSSVGLAVWERFGESREAVAAATLEAARREFPTADIEVCVNGIAHDSEEHDWESCQRCVDQAIKDEILAPGSVAFGVDSAPSVAVL